MPPGNPGNASVRLGFTPPALHAATGVVVADGVTELQYIAGTPRHAELIADCIRRLGIFRLSRRVTTVNRVFRRLTDGLPACPDPQETAAR